MEVPLENTTFSSKTNEIVIEKCTEWLSKCDLNDSESVSDDCSVTTESTENSAMDSGVVFQDSGTHVNNKVLCLNSNNGIDVSKILTKESNHFENIQIYKSKKVHIGDVTHINGPIYINHYQPSTSQPQIGNFNIITRLNWLAQPPLDAPKSMPEPAKFVVISHSATEEGFSQAKNTLLVRLMQTFHIESRSWNDIGYNFLVGSDGCVFEGRGWGIIGAHAYSYNKVSVGICFIGCFMDHLPPQVALKKAQGLIKHGVELGHIDPDYKLLGHCQCSSTESPGKVLFEEIKSWDHWAKDISIDNPSDLAQN